MPYSNEDFQRLVTSFDKPEFHSDTCLHVGMLWLEGQLNQDQIKLIQKRTERRTYLGLFRDAALDGSDGAYYNLGLCYHLPNTVVQQNFRTAARYFIRASERGHSLAKLELGFYYNEGKIGGRSNPEMAEVLFRDALKGNFRNYARRRLLARAPEFSTLVHG